MTATPFGLREIKLVSGVEVVQFPVGQTADVEFQFTGGELKGDDILWNKIALLESAKITLKNGGLSLEAMALLLTGTKTGDATYTQVRFVGGEVVRPVMLFARTMGPNGDDVHVKFFQVTVDTQKFNIGNGAYSITDTTLTAVKNQTLGRLMDIVHNVTATALPTPPIS